MRLGSALLVCLLASVAGPAYPQAPAAPPPVHLSPADILKQLPPDDASVQAMTLPEKADYYEKTHQWMKLSFTLQGVPNGFKSADEFRSVVSWMEKTVFGGGPIIVAFPYAAAVWAIAAHQSDPVEADKYKDTAAMVIVYAIAVSDVDSARCEDASVKNQMLARTMRDWRPVLEYLAGVPVDRRQTIVDRALSTEERTAVQRQDDYSLCSQGLDELHSRDQSKIVPGMGAPPNPSYVPKFKSAAEALPDQQRARRQLPVEILAILARFGMK